MRAWTGTVKCAISISPSPLLLPSSFHPTLFPPPPLLLIRSRSSTGGSSTPNPLSARSLFVQAQTAEEEAATSAPPKPLTRRLILLRHAESSWRSPTLRDHDRPLSKTGRADAAKVSRKLQQMGWVPELILSSDAVRTKETLQIMQENARGFLEAEVYFIASFYSIAAMDGQTAEHLEQTISEYARDEILTVMCMGHNRGWEEAASMLSGATIELKTCNAALLESAGNSWNEAFTTAGLGGWKFHGIVKPDIPE